MSKFLMACFWDEWHPFKSPLPWRERGRVRGKTWSITPTLVLPRQGGGKIESFAE